MTPYLSRIVAATASGLAGCLLLAACSSSALPTHASVNTPAVQVERSSTEPSPAASTDSPATAASGSACGLVTASEAGTVTGKAMKKVGDAGTICVYAAIADPSNLVHVTLFPDVHSMALQKQAESGGQHLPGLGDDAFWNPAGTIFVQKGSRGFSILVPSLTLTTRTVPKTISTLANIAVGRL